MLYCKLYVYAIFLVIISIFITSNDIIYFNISLAKQKDTICMSLSVFEHIKHNRAEPQHRNAKTRKGKFRRKEHGNKT